MSRLVYLSTLVVVVVVVAFFFTNLKVTKLCTSYRPIPEVAGIIICPLIEESFRSIWILRSKLGFFLNFFPLIVHVCPTLVSVLGIWNILSEFIVWTCHTTRFLGTLSQWVLRDEPKSTSAGRWSKCRTPTLRIWLKELSQKRNLFHPCSQEYGRAAAWVFWCH